MGLEQTIFKILWKEPGEPDEAKYYELFDVARFPVENLCDTVAYASHGMNTEQCVQWLIEKYNIDAGTELALYSYKQIKISEL